MIWGWPKLIGLGLAAIAIGILVWIVIGWKNDSEQLALVERENQELRFTIESMGEDYEEVQRSSEGYQSELIDIRNYVSHRPNRIVRVRDCTMSAPTPTGSGPESRLDEGSASPNVLPNEPGPDIGPRLRADAVLADGLSAQIRGMKTYITNVCLRSSPRSER